MKRSSAITLMLMGAGAYVVLPWLYRPESVSAEAYESVEQCALKGHHSREECQKAFDDAKAEHAQAAPRYARPENCEAEFGSATCAPQPGIGNAGFFVPAMAGFLMANGIGHTYLAQPLYRPCDVIDPTHPDPRCRGSSAFAGASGGGWSGPSHGGWLGGSNGFFTASGDRVASAPGPTSVASSTFGSHGPATTLSRGGFGARAAAFAGSGGGRA